MPSLMASKGGVLSELDPADEVWCAEQTAQPVAANILTCRMDCQSG